MPLKRYGFLSVCRALGVPLPSSIGLSLPPGPTPPPGPGLGLGPVVAGAGVVGWQSH